MELGNFKKALELYGKSLEIELQSQGHFHVNVADTNNNMGIIEEKLGNFQKALEYHEKALEIRIKSLGTHHMAVVDLITTSETLRIRLETTRRL